MHGRTASTSDKIMSRFWIPKDSQLVMNVIKNCKICKKYLSRPADRITAQFPNGRVNESPRFSVFCLDFAGRHLSKKCQGNTKILHMVIFTCGGSRALHLALVSDMTTSFFLLAFRRVT